MPSSKSSTLIICLATTPTDVKRDGATKTNLVTLRNYNVLSAAVMRNGATQIYFDHTIFNLSSVL